MTGQAAGIVIWTPRYDSFFVPGVDDTDLLASPGCADPVLAAHPVASSKQIANVAITDLTTGRRY